MNFIKNTLSIMVATSLFFSTSATANENYYNEDDEQGQGFQFFKDGIHEALTLLTRDIGNMERNNQLIENVEGKHIILHPLDNVTYSEILFLNTMANKLNFFKTTTIRDDDGRNYIMYDIKKRSVDARFTVKRLAESNIESTSIFIDGAKKYYYYPIILSQMVQDLSASFKNMPSKVVVLEKKVYIPVIEEKIVEKIVEKEVIRIVKINVPKIVIKEVVVPIERRIYVTRDGEIIGEEDVKLKIEESSNVNAVDKAFINARMENKKNDMLIMKKVVEIEPAKTESSKALKKYKTKNLQDTSMPEIKTEKKTIVPIQNASETEEDIQYIVKKLKSFAKFTNENTLVYENEFYGIGSKLEGYTISKIYSKTQGKYKATFIQFEDDPLGEPHLVASIYIEKEKSNKNQAVKKISDKKKTEALIERKASAKMVGMLEKKLDEKKDTVALSYKCDFNLIKTAYNEHTKKRIKIDSSHPYYNKKLNVDIITDYGKKYLVGAGNGLPNLLIRKAYFSTDRAYCEKNN